MPSYETHKKIGFIVSLILTAILAIFIIVRFNLWHWKMLLAVPVVWFYSNFPDLDHYLSKLRKKTLIFIFTVMLLSTIISAFVNIWMMLGILSLTGFLGILLLRVKHRGPLHTYPFVFVVALPLLLVHWFIFALALTAGWSHVFVDRLYSGIKMKLKKKLGLRDTYNMSVIRKEGKKIEKHVHYHIHNHVGREEVACSTQKD